MGITELQHAFDFILEEMQHGAVTASRREVGYNKPFDMVRATELSVGAQRLLNAVNFLASHYPDQPVFDVDLSRVKWLANISTRDHEWIDGLSTELQKAAIEVLDPDARNRGREEWVRMPLLGPAGVKYGRFVFELNSVHRRILQSPNRYAFFSLTRGHNLNGEHAPVLHDHLLQDLFRGHTDWIEIPEFLTWFGKADSKYYRDEGFRAIRRYIIEPALAEINLKAEYTASCESLRRGRKVSAVRFSMVKKTTVMADQEVNEVRSKLYDVLRTEFNLSTTDFDQITAKSEVWTEARLMEVIELTRYRIEYGKTEVASPRALFMHLLRNEAVMTPVERERAEKARKATEKKARADKNSKNLLAESASKAATTVDSALDRFALLDPSEQETLIERFRDSPIYGAAQLLIRRSGDMVLTPRRLLDDVKLRGIFATFLEQETQGRS